jgi:hypothetical protein
MPKLILRGGQVFFSRHVRPDGVTNRVPTQATIRGIDFSDLAEFVEQTPERL